MNAMFSVWGRWRTASPKRLTGQTGMLTNPVGHGVAPKIMASKVTPIMPSRIAPRIPRAIITPMARSPNRANPTDQERTSPRLTRVAGLSTMRPAFFSPMNAMNRPIPAATALFSGSGTALMIASRTRNTVNSRNSNPEARTTPRASFQSTPMPRTMV